MTNKKEEAQKVMDEFYFTFVNERQDFFIQKLNNIAIANALRELVNQLKYIGITEKNILEIVDELEVL